MQYFDTSNYEQEEKHHLPRNQVIAAVPIILFLAFFSGSLAFVFGRSAHEAIASPGRVAKLPVAKDQKNTPVSNIKPISALKSSPTNVLAPVNTDQPGNWLQIPALQVKVPLAEAESMKDQDILTALQEGVVMYPNGILPGEKGRLFISGHSTGEPWKGAYRFAFMKLSKLRPGDTVLVDYNGKRYTYKISGSQKVDPQKKKYLESSASEPILSLMSCWPLWTTRNRLLVNAELAAINPLAVK